MTDKLLDTGDMIIFYNEEQFETGENAVCINPHSKHYGHIAMCNTILPDYANWKKVTRAYDRNRNYDLQD